MHRLSFFGIFLLIACQSTPRSKFQNEEGGFPGTSEILTNAQGENKQLASVGRLKGAMNCTAVLWKPFQDWQGAALILTNGHCVQNFSNRATAYEVQVNRPAAEAWSVTFNDFIDTQNDKRSYKIKSVLYSTMQALDLAILELDTPLAQVVQDGWQPFLTAALPVPAGSEIQVAGFPEKGVAVNERFLRTARCVEETRISVVEWFWHWFDTHRNSCADIREGSSGSPVFNALGEIYALINTTSAGSISNNCYLGNPCEMRDSGAVRVEQKNYAIDVINLPRCFSAGGTLQFHDECPLPPPQTLGYAGAPTVPTLPVDRLNQPILWGLTLTSESFTEVQWKFGPVGEIDCRQDDDYSEVQALPGQVLSGTALPKANGVYLLCLVGRKADLKPDFRFPTLVVLSIDTIPPTLKPQLSLREQGTSLFFEPIFQVPELSGYKMGYGPVATTSCDTLALSIYRRIPVRINAVDLPARICVQGEDHVGNQGPVFEYLVPQG